MDYRIEYPHGVTFIRNKKIIGTPTITDGCIEIHVHDGAQNIAYIVDELRRRGITFFQQGSVIRLSFGMCAVLLMQLKNEKPGLFKKTLRKAK